VTAFTGHIRQNCFFLGQWEQLELSDDEIAETFGGGTRGRLDLMGLLPRIYANTGRADRVRALFELMPAEPSAEVQDITAHAIARATLARIEGRQADALAEAETVLTRSDEIGIEHPFSRMAVVDVLETAYALEDFDSIQARIEEFRRLPPAEQLPFMAAQAVRFEALVSARAGETEVAEQRFKRATALLREIDARFYLAVVLLEHGEWLVAAGRPDEAEPLLAEAREIFGRLGAAPWLERLDAIGEPAPA